MTSMKSESELHPSQMTQRKPALMNSDAEKEIARLRAALKTVREPIAKMAAQIMCPVDNVLTRTLRVIDAALEGKDAA